MATPFDVTTQILYNIMNNNAANLSNAAKNSQKYSVLQIKDQAKGSAYLWHR